MLATVESIWQEIFEPFHNLSDFNRFPEVVRRMYETIENGNSRYPGFFSVHYLSFASEGKKEGIEMMNSCFCRLKENLLAALRKDTSVNPKIFNDDFSDEKFIEYVFALLLSSLLQKEDLAPLLTFISNYIYKSH